jgi:multidrug efflux system outer membrane protein
LPAELLERLPDLFAAERRLAAADKDLRASRKELLPKISLTASGGTSSREFQDLLDSDFSVWTLGSNLTEPIFQGGRILANIDRAKAIRMQSEAAYRDVALRAFQEVESGLAGESFLQSEYTRLAEAAEEAKAAERLAWDQYRAGTSDFLSALDARRTADSAESRFINVRNLLLQNRTDLYLALGGSFHSEP